MALGLVLLGVASGMVTAFAVLALGGGVGLAALAYLGGGTLGLLAGLTPALLPRRHGVALLATSEHR
jgi:hypothetical protein